MADEQYVELVNLCGGAAAELFEKELERVLANVQDPNMPARAKRGVQLSVEITPDEDRERCHVDVSCVSKLPKRTGAHTQIFVGVKGGRHVAVEYDPRQMGLFDKEGDRNELRAVDGGRED